MAEEQTSCFLKIDWTEKTAFGIFANDTMVKIYCFGKDEVVILRKEDIIGIRYDGEHYALSTKYKDAWKFSLLLKTGACVNVVLGKEKFTAKHMYCVDALEFLVGICGLSDK